MCLGQTEQNCTLCVHMFICLYCTLQLPAPAWAQYCHSRALSYLLCSDWSNRWLMVHLGYIAVHAAYIAVHAGYILVQADYIQAVVKIAILRVDQKNWLNEILYLLYLGLAASNPQYFGLDPPKYPSNSLLERILKFLCCQADISQKQDFTGCFTHPFVELIEQLFSCI